MPIAARFRWVAPFISIAFLAACGFNNSPQAAASASPSASPQQSPEPSGTVQTGGDIPDNVVWLSYSGTAFSIQYPEGWVRNTTSSGATFSDKDSHVSVAVNTGPAPTTQSVTSEVAAIGGAKITAAARQITLPAGIAIKITYEVLGPADPVTGKQPRLTVDRYEIGHSGQVAVLDLAAQVGIDNVDAYLAMAKSFKWAA